MIKTLTKHGNSLALVVEKPVLDLIGADATTKFDVTTDGDVLILTPIKDKGREKKVRASLERINSKFAASFRELAK